MFATVSFVSTAAVLLVVLNSMLVQLITPTDSIDYWIGNISPRCAINIIHFNFTTNFTYSSIKNIPVIFTPLNHVPEERSRYMYLRNQHYTNFSLRFLKAECYFSIIYYEMSPNAKQQNTSDVEQDFIIINHWISASSYGYFNREAYYSNTTYCLILYYRGRGEESINDEVKSTLGFRKEVNLALIHLSRQSTQAYSVYCRTSSTKLQVAGVFARNSIINKTASIVDQKFIDFCSSTYTFVAVSEHHLYYGVYDPTRLVSEHEVINLMLRKVNASLVLKSNTTAVRWNYYIPLILINDMGSSSSFYPTFDNSIRVFTCYSPPVLSFHFYISAFQKNVWIFLCLSGVLFAAFLNCHIYYNISKTMNFSSVLLYLSIFMEESYSIPSSIGNNKVYRIATTLWLLTSVVLTNIYVSHVISGLNAPLSGEKLWSLKDLYENKSNVSDNEIHNFYSSRYQFAGETNSSKYFDNHMKSILDTMYRSQSLTAGFRFLSEPIKLTYPEDVWLHITNLYIYRVTFDNSIQIYYCLLKPASDRAKSCRDLLQLMHPSNKHYPSGHTYKRPWSPADYLRGAVEEELVQCQKSVYLEQSNQMEFKYMSENYKKKRFYYLQEGYSFTTSIWSFYNLQKSKLPFYFSLFLQSGVYHQLHKIQLFKEYQRRRSVTSEIIERTQKPEVLDMTSSVQTIFILYLAMSFLAICVLHGELGFFLYYKRRMKLCLSKRKTLKANL